MLYFVSQESFRNRSEIVWVSGAFRSRRIDFKVATCTSSIWVTKLLELFLYLFCACLMALFSPCVALLIFTCPFIRSFANWLGPSFFLMNQSIHLFIHLFIHSVIDCYLIRCLICKLPHRFVTRPHTGQLRKSGQPDELLRLRKQTHR